MNILRLSYPPLHGGRSSGYVGLPGSEKRSLVQPLNLRFSHSKAFTRHSLIILPRSVYVFKGEALFGDHVAHVSRPIADRDVNA